MGKLTCYIGGRKYALTAEADEAVMAEVAAEAAERVAQVKQQQPRLSELQITTIALVDCCAEQLSQRAALVEQADCERRSRASKADTASLQSRILFLENYNQLLWDLWQAKPADVQPDDLNLAEAQSDGGKPHGGEAGGGAKEGRPTGAERKEGIKIGARRRKRKKEMNPIAAQLSFEEWLA